MTKRFIDIEAEPYGILLSSEVLEATGKQGKKWWQAHVVRDVAGVHYTTTSAWHETSLGNISTVSWAVPRQARPKNVGRSNETTNEQQAYAEFESMVALEKRLRSGDRIMPMLAATFIDRVNPKKSKKKHIQYPCIVQPKYDGKRLLSDGEVAWSRGNKDTNPETVAHIFPINTEGLILDGELLLPRKDDGSAPKVSEVMSAINKFHPGVSDTLVYTIYDIADLTLTYAERRKRLDLWWHTSGADNHPFLRRSTDYKVASESEGLRIHADLTGRGFEGSIWRNLDGMYADGKRVTDLQKHKDWIEEEFPIRRVVPQGEGIAARRAKFICGAANGEEFESNAIGSDEIQQGYLRDAESLVGKYAKVKYRELTVYGTPFHSNTLEVRETKDGGY